MPKYAYRLRLSFGDLFLATECAYFAYCGDFLPFIILLPLTIFLWGSSVYRVEIGQSHDQR